MLSLLALLSAGTAPAAGFAGGALIGAQAGYSYINLKRLAKDKAITKDEAGKLYDAIYTSLTTAANYTPYDTVADAAAIAALKDDEKAGTVVVKVSSPKKVEDYVQAFETLKGKRGVKVVQVAVVTDAAGKGAFNAGVIVAGIKTELDKVKRDDVVKALVNEDAEGKYTSNNGFAGVHVGYLGRVNDKFMVGGLVEGNWVFGKDLKLDLTDKEEKDTSARFNVNAYLRAMFNLTEKFMVGADLGVAAQEIRKLKEVGKTDKESKWFWGPAARLVLGVSLTDNVLATAHFGGVFPMMQQDHFDKSFKAKYTNFTGGVGISYAFGA